tara:strand:+ start:309 stop:587 length:279 start_codon:yes stop_codon:yes gene_type:complete
MTITKDRLWWSKHDKEWFVHVASDHEQSIERHKPDWWEGTEQVLAKGYDWSKKYGWFIKVGVPAKHYLKHHPEDIYLVNQMIQDLNNRRRKK